MAVTACAFIIVSHTWMYRLLLKRKIASGATHLSMPVNTSEYGNPGEQKWQAVTVMAFVFNIIIIAAIVFGHVGE